MISPARQSRCYSRAFFLVVWGIGLSPFLVAGKVAAGIRRKIGGEAVVLTEYAGPGEVGFAGEHPGTIRAVELGHGEEIVVRRRGFLAASPSVDLSVAMVTRLRAGVLAGHTLVLQRLSGPGTVFVHAAGDFAGFTLGPGEVLRADSAALVWFDASVDYSAAWAGTVKRALLGGEGLFLSTFTGPGRVTLQTMGRAPGGMELIHRDVIENAIEKFDAFTDVQKLKAARRIDQFFAANPGLDQNPSRATAHRAFIKNNANRIEAAVEKLWGVDKKGKLNTPEHWSGQNLIDRSKPLGKDVAYLVVKDYDRRNFAIHTGVAGILNIGKENFEALCAFALNVIGDCMLAELHVLGKELKLVGAIGARI